MRARFVSCLVVSVFCLAFTPVIFAQTSSVVAAGNSAVSFEETGAASAEGGAFTSSVSGLQFQFHQSRAAVDVAPAGISQANPIRLSLAGASPMLSLSPEGRLPLANLRSWSALRYHSVYPGVDLVYYGNHGQLEYDFVVAPQRDPERIVMRVDNVQHVEIASDGRLNISGAGESLSFSEPVIYQVAQDGSHELVAGRYVMKGAGLVGFDIPNWDRSRPLIIDPTLTWSSYAGNAGDTFYAHTIDSSGNLYLVGRTGSSMLVEKLTSDGTTVTYRFVLTATPSYSAQAEDIRVDSTGIAYIVGYSGVNFPTTSNAFLGSVTSGTHAFVAVLNAAGTALTYASYLAGSSGTDEANAVAVDSTGKVYVTGYTYSTTFPTTTGVYQTHNANGSQTAFVSKLDPTKSGAASLLYSTYIGGPVYQSSENAIAVDGSGNAYVAGNAGQDFPITTGAFAYDGEGLGQGGVYVTKLNATATALSYSAYLGPGTANGLAVDGSGDVYVTGTVGIEDFPTTTGAYQVIYPGGFATELNPDGNTLVYATFLSGPMELATPVSIAIEPGCSSACNAFITGYTSENDLSLTSPIQNFNASFVNGSSGNDFFVTVLNGTGAATVYSTYIGGSSDESTAGGLHSPSIAANTTGDAFVLGETSSSDFPVTLTATPQRSEVAFRIGAAAGVMPVVYPTTLAFSTQQPVGVASAAMVVTLRNMGSNTMTITSITPSPSDYSETNTCGSSLAGGGECAIDVTFNPTTAASRPGTLTILQGGNSTVVNLTGTGTNSPFLTLTPSSLNFADQTVNTASPYQTVTISNTAATTLTFGGTPFTISTNFAQTNNCPATLAHNASCTMNIAFLPTQNGAFSGQMYVTSNSSGLATTYVNLSGNGVAGAPGLTLSSAGLVFGPQDEGTTSPSQGLTVFNTSDVPVTIFGTSVTGTAYTDYAASGCIATVYPGGSCSVRVNFSPTATGSRAATVNLADSTTARSHSFTVTGTGVAPTLTLSINPTAVTFADLAVGATSTPALLVQVTNTGNAIVPIDRVSTTGDFRISNTSCVTNLRVGSTCSIYVEFTPTAAGARTGKIIIEDAASGNPQSVALSGNGVVDAAAATASPDGYSFGNQAQGTTSASSPTVYLTNIGNLPFDASKVSITGANAGDFQISYNGCSGDFLIPGRNCGVTTTFAPTATGARTAALTFTNAAGTQTATLSGTAVASTFALGITPTTLTYQPQQKGVASPTQTVWLNNTGSAPVSVTTIVTGSTDYQTSGCASTTIQPNTSCAVNVYLQPTVTTTDNSTLTITSNATGSPQVVTLNGSGATAPPAVQLSPPGLSFSMQVVSTTSNSQSVGLVNTTASSVTGIAVAAPSGTNASDFTISSNNCTATLAAGAGCSFFVTFKPGATGARSAAINITDSAGTQTVTLAGYGVASFTSALLVDTALTFPSETVGFPSPTQYITFQNTGNTPFPISSVVLGGTNAGDFAISSGCPITPTQFNPFASCNTGVTFTPTAAGTRTATVTITYSGAAGSPVTATLTGMGVTAAQALEIGPASVTFPPQVIATQSPISPNVLVTNTGTSPVAISSIALGGTNAGDFTISNSCPTSPSTLQQGPLNNTCQVSVNFTPTAAGARSATLTITHSAPGSPKVITVSGTGVAQTKTLAVTPTTLVFGPQVTGTTSPQQSITVTNTGNFNVTFTNVTISTNYALSNGCTGQLYPGGSCTIGVTFTPTSAVTKTGTVTITSNATGPAPKVSLSGTGIATTADIQLSQTAVAFDAQTVSTQSPTPQLVYYYNQGNTTVTINTIALGGTNPGDFSTSGSSCSAGGQVSAQSYCNFRINFTPSAAGTRSAILTITDTDPGSPRTITLSGIGISSAVSEVALTPASLTFASQSEGTTSAPQNINLTNSGTASLTITNIALTGTDPGDYAQTNNCPISPATLAAGFSCNIAVTFSPLGSGARPAAVTVTDNASGSPHSATLTGTGLAGVATITPASLAFPNVPLGTASAPQVITVKSTGTAPLVFTNVAITGTVSSDFSEMTTCTGSLAKNATCTITVTFTPTTIESQAGTVTITDNAANSPQTVPITANGAEAAVDISPSSLTFPSQTVGTTSAPKTITLENYGDATLTLGSVATVGPFVVSANTCGTSLAAGSICTISVEFKPLQTGAANGDLVLTDNAGDSPQMIVLTGTGT